jgi:hypothetical protein
MQKNDTNDPERTRFSAHSPSDEGHVRQSAGQGVNLIPFSLMSLDHFAASAAST